MKDIYGEFYENNNGEKRVIESLVIVGQFCVGNTKMKEPDYDCDTTVDDVYNPNIVAVFRDYQAFPAYLITIKKESEWGKENKDNLSDDEEEFSEVAERLQKCINRINLQVTEVCL